MKQRIYTLLLAAVESLQKDGLLPAGTEQNITIERSRQPEHGDFASNLALALAKASGLPPRELAQRLIDGIPGCDILERCEIAGPGFINFHLKKDAYLNIIDTIKTESENYGKSNIGANKRVLVEFVSSNPTGPLHVGHGRGAAYGDAVSRVLRAAGYDTESEYYLNDAGRQMDILTTSVWLRYLDLCGENVDFPDNGYHGDYIWDIAASLHRQHGDQYRVSAQTLLDNLPNDVEKCIDELIRRCKDHLGDEGYKLIFNLGLNALVENIRNDLTQFGVEYDNWFSEQSLFDSGAVKDAIELLKSNGHLYESDGAWWFRSSTFGDEKDRVVVRADGSYTYFASDIAYHYDKGRRGYDRLLNIFGADHHGYVSRIKASFAALGNPYDALQIQLVQFAVLYRGAEKVSMSTRSGDFVTLRELRQEVGNDAARFFYVLHKSDQHMDFDLELAKSQSNDNPVYYVQYAHARICSVFRQLEEKQLSPKDNATPDYILLKESHELELLRELSRFSEVVELAARDYAPHLIAYYLRDLANRFHTYYNAHPFLSCETDLRHARLGLIDATRQVIANGLAMLGVSAPSQM